jgi:hypothetical protein
VNTEPRLPFLQRLPENVTLLSVCVAHGLDLDSFDGSLYLCPFHAEKKPSLKLNNPDSRDGWFYCFGCGATGDVIHWVSRRYEISKVGAYRQLRAERGLGHDESLGSRPELGPVHIGGLRDFTNQELGDSAHRAISPLRRLRSSSALQSSNMFPTIADTMLTPYVIPSAGSPSCGE